MKIFKKKIQISFEKIVIFSNIFLPILHNIGLYIYTIKYKSDIEIPGFLRNISKTNLKNFQMNFPVPKKNCFHAYGQILKNFQPYFH